MTHALKSLWRYIKIATLLGPLMLLPMSLRAQGYITGQVISPAGTPAAYATVRVCPYSGGGGLPCSPLSSIYSDLALTQSVANPYTADQWGNFSVAAASSTYIVQVTVSGAVYSYLYTVGAGGSGFPIVLGSTSIASGSTTTSLAGLTVNGVTLSASGSPSQYLNGTGSYSTPAGITSINSQTGPVFTIACATGLTCTTTLNTVTISLATVFAITSFTGGWTVPVGASVVNPTFAATYTTTPASANITNTDSIDSPLMLTTPFTSGTVTGTFVHTTPETTTFTLSATQGSTVTATQTGNWGYEIFGGYGAAGATSTVNASGTTAVLSNLTVLPRLQIGAETVGEPLGPFNGLTGQNIYLLLTGGSHTFTSAGLPAAFNAPLTVSFVNANGASVTMYLYQSTNALYGNYTIVVAS
jgi:hypothetical protein